MAAEEEAAPPPPEFDPALGGSPNRDLLMKLAEMRGEPVEVAPRADDPVEERPEPAAEPAPAEPAPVETPRTVEEVVVVLDDLAARLAALEARLA